MSGSKRTSTHSFEAWGYSDDCAGITGATDDAGEEAGDYDTPDRLFELLIDGVVVGKCRMSYCRSGWTFEAEADVEISAGRLLDE